MGVPAVDPTRQTALMRTAIAFARKPAGRWFGINVASRVDPVLLKLSGGRVSTFAMAPVVMLTVPGRRSGVPRTSALLYFTQGDDVVVIASSFGRDRHPAWYGNVMAHPDVQLTAGGRGGTYVAREAMGEERERLWAIANRLYPGYDDYKQRAAAVGRTIPVLVLSPKP